LRSSIPEDRASAFEALFGNIVHQGSVYDATSWAVPFIIELLRAPDVLDTEYLVLLLAAIAEGHGYFEVHVRVDNREFWDGVLAKKGTNLADQLERERGRVRAVRKAVEPGLDLLLPFLSKGVSETRMTVASALANFPDRAAEFVPALERALAMESDDDVREQITTSLRALREAG
jgi:hypothetical protein